MKGARIDRRVGREDGALRAGGLSWFGRDPLATALAVVVAAASLLGLVVLVGDPAPPKRIVVSAGLDGSVYQRFAERYKVLLAGQHVDLEIRRSAGSMQNLHDLAMADADADVAFIQSGTSNDNVASRRRLVSLGSLFVEPVWVFYRQAALDGTVDDRAVANPGHREPHAPGSTPAPHRPMRDATPLTRLEQLRGLRLNAGTMGSGGPRLARQLLEINDLRKEDLTLTDFDDATAAAMLVAGSLDAVMFVTAPEAPLVQELLQAPGVRLANFDEAEAYSRRYPFLKHVVLPKGIVSFSRGIPDEDVHLIAPTATLVARDTLHPAAIELLMHAVAQAHGGPSWFGRSGEFPNDQYTEVPVAPVAERYYRSGPSFLQRYLPFWLASYIERLGVLLVPLVALAIPLSRVVPPLYAWRVRSRLYRWYGELREVENDVARAVSRVDPVAGQGAAGLAACVDRLAVIKARVDGLEVPLAFANELLTLRMHIERVGAGLASTRRV